ncbi:MAG: nucleotide exchange factor GrpE, partial [Anaerolineae bacterium]|nr:nucleotide exchange factor GrpE [Anaerolineae bacterium]
MTLTDRPVRIPVRQLGATDGQDSQKAQSVSAAADAPAEAAPANGAAAAGEARRDETSRAGPQIDWKDRALRLQAEMQTYRQRQQRWAQEQVREEKAELLTRFLEVVDNLEQALKHIDPNDAAHQGVRMAYDGLLRMLIREDVERIFAKGRVFDPDVHEAVAVVPAPPGHGDDMRVVEVMTPGYRYKDRVLR